MQNGIIFHFVLANLKWNFKKKKRIKKENMYNTNQMLKHLVCQVEKRYHNVSSYIWRSNPAAPVYVRGRPGGRQQSWRKTSEF